MLVDDLRLVISCEQNTEAVEGRHGRAPPYCRCVAAGALGFVGAVGLLTPRCALGLSRKVGA